MEISNEERLCVTGEGEGVRGAMLHSFLPVAGEEGAEASSPGNPRKREEVELKSGRRGCLSESAAGTSASSAVERAGAR